MRYRPDVAFPAGNHESQYASELMPLTGRDFPLGAPNFKHERCKLGQSA